MYAMSVNEITNWQFQYWHFNKYFIFVHQCWCYELICIKRYCI